MKTIALLVGVALLGLGIACFIPGLAADGVMFGMFPVSTPLALAFIITGAVGVMIGLRRTHPLEIQRGTNDLRD